jgi:putative transposase
MARQLRVQFKGAVYHVTSRGNERKDIVRSDKDRELFLRVLAQMLEDYQVICHAWVLMDNHYHLLLETPEANLSKALRHLNGIYTQKFNRRNRRTGHLFQGRYKALLVEKGSHLLELCRYVVLNPVRAKMVKKPREWKWSSYRATVGIDKKDAWLTTDWVLGHFAGKRTKAQKQYVKFVLEGMKVKKSPWEDVSGIYYGGDGLKKQIKNLLRKKDDLEIPMSHKRLERQTAEKVIERIARSYKVKTVELLRVTRRPNEARDIAVWLLRKEAGLGLKEIGEKLGVRYSAVGNRIAVIRRKLDEDDKFRRRISECKVKT